MESHCERWMMSMEVVIIEMAEAVYKIIQTKEPSTL
jgi:phenolic acid decarboxylase